MKAFDFRAEIGKMEGKKKKNDFPSRNTAEI